MLAQIKRNKNSYILFLTIALVSLGLYFTYTLHSNSEDLFGTSNPEIVIEHFNLHAEGSNLKYLIETQNIRYQIQAKTMDESYLTRSSYFENPALSIYDKSKKTTKTLYPKSILLNSEGLLMRSIDSKMRDAYVDLRNGRVTYFQPAASEVYKF